MSLVRLKPSLTVGAHVFRNKILSFSVGLCCEGGADLLRSGLCTWARIFWKGVSCRMNIVHLRHVSSHHRIYIAAAPPQLEQTCKLQPVLWLEGSVCVCACVRACAPVCSVMSDSWWPHGPHQAHLSMEFSRQECRSGLAFPPPGDLPNASTEHVSYISCTGQAGSLLLLQLGKSTLWPCCCC